MPQEMLLPLLMPPGAAAAAADAPGAAAATVDTQGTVLLLLTPPELLLPLLTPLERSRLLLMPWGLLLIHEGCHEYLRLLVQDCLPECGTRWTVLGYGTEMSHTRVGVERPMT